jgi:hypothetical protein
MSNSDIDRWMVWTTQAQNFARRENFFEGVARMKLVVSEVKQAIDAASDDETKADLGRFLVRAERQQAKLEAAFEAWNAKAAELKRARLEGADEEMKRPLPIPPPRA